MFFFILMLFRQLEQLPELTEHVAHGNLGDFVHGQPVVGLVQRVEAKQAQSHVIDPHNRGPSRALPRNIPP